MTIKDKREKNNILTKCLISRQIPVECKYVNNNITSTLLRILQNTIEGKCIEEGYIQKQSIKIVNYSSGLIKSNIIIFQVVFECFVYHLVEGVELSCIAKNITKAGIRAELDVEDNPVIIFVARDHHYINSSFNKVKEGDDILVKVIGQRYELNDINICIIAELIKINKSKKIETNIQSKSIMQSKDNVVLSKQSMTKVKSQSESKQDKDSQIKSIPEVESSSKVEDKVEDKEESQKIIQADSEPNIEIKIETKKDEPEKDEPEKVEPEKVEPEKDESQQEDGSKKPESTIVENVAPVKRKPGRPKKIKQ